MPRRLAQQRMTSSDLEWPFYPLRALYLRYLLYLLVFLLTSWGRNSVSECAGFNVTLDT